MASQVFYHPSDQGWEGQRRKTILERRELVLSAPAPADGDETLTWTDERNTPWVRRLANESGPLSGLRTFVFDTAAIQRHHRVWVASDTSGLLLLEALRRTPEGRVWASLPNASQVRSIAEYLSFVPEFHQPVWGDRGWGIAPEVPPGEPVPSFDRVLAWGPTLPDGWRLPDGGTLVEPDPTRGSRLTDWIPSGTLEPELTRRLREAEDEYWTARDPKRIREHEGLQAHSWSSEAKRSVSKDDWQRWWTPGSGRWLDGLVDQDEAWNSTLERLRDAWPTSELLWRRSWVVWTRFENKEVP